MFSARCIEYDEHLETPIRHLFSKMSYLLKNFLIRMENTLKSSSFEPIVQSNFNTPTQRD